MSQVTHLIKFGIQQLRVSTRIKKEQKDKKIKESHIKFLTSQQALQNWAHLPLRQRAIMFHRKYLEVKISATTIQNIYRKAGIKYKYIRRVKKKIGLTIP